MANDLFNSFMTGPDEQGRFGDFGGRFVSETLMPLILELEEQYEKAKTDDSFWAEMANSFLAWDLAWDSVVDYYFVSGDARWCAGGKLNVSYNCIDRHLPERADHASACASESSRSPQATRRRGSTW